jgi:hypothetical protein
LRRLDLVGRQAGRRVRGVGRRQGQLAHPTLVRVGEPGVVMVGGIAGAVIAARHDRPLVLVERIDQVLVLQLAHHARDLAGQVAAHVLDHRARGVEA